MYPVQDKSEVSVSEYLAILRRRWVWILLAMVVIGGLSLANDLRAPKVYRSSTQLLLRSSPSENIFNVNASPADPTRALQNELSIINSRTVRIAAAKDFGRPIVVQAASGGEDDVIILSATADKGALAARIVNSYAQTYQSARVDAQLQDLAKARLTVQQQLDDFSAQIAKVDAPVAALDARIVDLAPNDPVREGLVAQRDDVVSRTTAQRNELQNQLNDYQQRLQTLQLSERLTTTGGVEILNPGGIPSSPISPTILRDLVQALVIGLFVGMGLAFLRDQLDDSLRSKADLDRVIGELPTIGLVPVDPTWRDGSKGQITAAIAPMSATSEAFRGLRTTLQFLAVDQPMGLIQVTSAGPGEGKSTVTANLALTFAQAGKKVAVVGCDLRKPRLANFFDVDPNVGLTSVLVNEVTLEEALQPSPVHPNISILAAGPLPPNPSELLSLDRTATTIRSLLDTHQYVFLDCPPVLPVTDSLVLSRFVDATIFLAAAERTTKRKARRAVEMLQQVESPLVGAVLNGVSGESSYGSLYEYYGYVHRSRIPVIGRFLKPRILDMPDQLGTKAAVERSEHDTWAAGEDPDPEPSLKGRPSDKEPAADVPSR